MKKDPLISINEHSQSISGGPGTLPDRFQLPDRVDGMIARYAELVRLAMPELSVNEWHIICEVCQSQTLDIDADFAINNPKMIRMSIEDVEDCVVTKWGVDRDALVHTLRELPYASLVSINEVTRRFWASADNRDIFSTKTEMILHCGARIKQEVRN